MSTTSSTTGRDTSNITGSTIGSARDDSLVAVTVPSRRWLGAPGGRGGRVGVDAQAGMATLELAVLALVLLMLFSLLIAAGRVSQAKGAVDQAAADAAREASLARTSAVAVQQGERAAAQTLNRQGLQCSTLQVSVNTAAFGTRVGTVANVGATVTCQVQLSDLALPGLPGTKTVTSTWLSPLDTNKERG